MAAQKKGRLTPVCFNFCKLRPHSLLYVQSSRFPTSFGRIGVPGIERADGYIPSGEHAGPDART